MRSKNLAIVAVSLVLGLATWVQASSRPARQDRDKDDQGKQAQKAQKVKLTHGPVVESARGNQATIAWSTNVKASTILRYGTNPSRLDRTAEAPWGGVTHRVYLRNLAPGTTYYFQVESTQAQGTGSQAVSGLEHFRTQGAAAAAAQPARAASQPAAAAAVSPGEQLPLRNFHGFLLHHPDIKGQMEKDPSLAHNRHYLAIHPGLSQFLQTHPGVRQYLAQNPTGFMQSEAVMR